METAAMELPVIVKIITLICCAIAFFILVAYEKVLPWLGAGAKYVVKLVLAGGKYIAEAGREVEEYLTRKPKPPKTV